MITKYFVTYLQYNQVFNSPPLSLIEIKEICSQLEKKSFLEILCKINIALWKSLESTKDMNLLQVESTKLLFSRDDARKVINQAKAQNAFIFYRQQVLYLIKIILLTKTDSGKKIKCTDNNRKILGRILLSLSNYTEPLGQDYIILSKEHELDNLRRSSARNWYFIHSGIFFNKIARSLILWLKIPITKRGKNLLQNTLLYPKKEFYQETRLSILDFVGFAMTTIIPYWKINLNAATAKDFFINIEKFFSKTKLSDIKKGRIFKQLILDKNRFFEIYNKFIEEVLDGNDIPEYNFLPFENKPLLKITDNLIIPLDPTYLTNKVTDGIYWILLNRFKRQGEEKIGKGRELSKYYGYLIQEYVYQILVNICDEVFEFSQTTEKTSDFIGTIKYNNRLYLIVVESKKIALSYKTLIFSDKESMLKDLEKIFGEKTGFVQIYETIKRLRQNNVKAFNININNVDGIFPVLVTDSEIFEDPLSRLLYENEFLNKHKERLLYTPHPIIFEPIFISLDELEVIESCCNSLGKEQFIKLLLERDKILKIRDSINGLKNIPIKIIPLWNHLWELGFMEFKNENLKRTFSNYYINITKRLFGKESNLILDKSNN